MLLSGWSYMALSHVVLTSVTAIIDDAQLRVTNGGLGSWCCPSHNSSDILGTESLREAKGATDQIENCSSIFPCSNTLPSGHVSTLFLAYASCKAVYKTHGILNAVSWGILLPMGGIVARYLKTFKSADPLWFYLHVACQPIGCGVGVSSWAIGIHLGNLSKGITYSLHRNIGIAVFAIGTLQIIALFLRPKKDHKFCVYWNSYHYSVGYTIIILGIVNILRGVTSWMWSRSGRRATSSRSASWAASQWPWRPLVTWFCVDPTVMDLLSYTDQLSM